MKYGSAMAGQQAKKTNSGSKPSKNCETRTNRPLCARPIPCNEKVQLDMLPHKAWRKSSHSPLRREILATPAAFNPFPYDARDIPRSALKRWYDAIDLLERSSRR